MNANYSKIRILAACAFALSSTGCAAINWDAAREIRPGVRDRKSVV